MRSWVFRHRLQLHALYAPHPVAPPARIPARTRTRVERRGAHTFLEMRAARPGRARAG